MMSKTHKSMGRPATHRSWERVHFTLALRAHFGLQRRRVIKRGGRKCRPETFYRILRGTGPLAVSIGSILFVSSPVPPSVPLSYEKELGVTDNGKILLKTTHVWIGYVFAINLAWRIIWAFIGNAGKVVTPFFPSILAMGQRSRPICAN